MQVYGIDALIRLVSHMGFIYLAFWSLQSLKLETFFKRGNTTQVRMILVMLAMALGFQVSSFFLECLSLIRNFAVTILQ